LPPNLSTNLPVASRIPSAGRASTEKVPRRVPVKCPVPSANALKWMTPLSTRVSSAGCPVQGWTPMSAVGSFTSRDRRTLGERGAR
jgi:hypothetical protein